MANQDLLTMRQLRTIRADGEVEFVTHGAVIQPDRSSFASKEELSAYLVETLGGKAEHGGVGGFLSRKGTYVRRSANGVQAVTFGDPLLDAISSAAGTVVIEGKTIDLLAGRPSVNPLRRAGNRVVAADAPALKMTGIVHDAERWATDDGSYVEYRI